MPSDTCNRRIMPFPDKFTDPPAGGTIYKYATLEKYQKIICDSIISKKYATQKKIKSHQKIISKSLA